MKTVGELIKFLEGYSSDTRLLATWEGQVFNVEAYMSSDKVVLIDADRGYYKDKFIKDGVGVIPIYSDEDVIDG